jgi:hypothetical protein
MESTLFDHIATKGSAMNWGAAAEGARIGTSKWLDNDPKPKDERLVAAICDRQAMLLVNLALLAKQVCPLEHGLDCRAMSAAVWRGLNTR